jgi:hypothetical protein
VDDLVAAERVLEPHADLALLGGVLDDVELFDVAFVAQHVCDPDADLARGI